MTKEEMEALKVSRRIKTNFVHPPIPIRTMLKPFRICSTRKRLGYDA